MKLTNEEIIKLIKSDEEKDLHIHSVFSDGVLTPEEIVDRWMDEGKKTIAITDHDGIGGSIVAVKYAQNKPINVIPGIEFDSECELGKDLHILGYGIDFENDELHAKLKNILQWRAERNEKILLALEKMGHVITEEEINSINDGRYVGKPTFARVLVKRGLYKDLKEVFEKFFGNIPEIKNIKKVALSSKEVVDTIHAAGGLVVLAHPMEQMKSIESFEQFKPRLFNLLDSFVEYGIDGIECYHPSADEEQSELLRKYAESHGLLVTRGSDFHFDGLKRKYTRD